jgi:hypothetical protein
MNFHPEIKHRSFIREHNTIKVDQKLIDKMINAPEIIKPIEPVAEEVKQEEISVEEEHPQIIQEPIIDDSVNIDTIDLEMQPEPYKTQEVASLDFEQAETEEAEETVTTNSPSDVQNIDNSIDLGNFTETIPDDLSINFADDNNIIERSVCNMLKPISCHIFMKHNHLFYYRWITRRNFMCKINKILADTNIMILIYQDFNLIF